MTAAAAGGAVDPDHFPSAETARVTRPDLSIPCVIRNHPTADTLRSTGPEFRGPDTACIRWRCPAGDPVAALWSMTGTGWSTYRPTSRPHAALGDTEATWSICAESRSPRPRAR